jgi:hypothetical protein
VIAILLDDNKKNDEEEDDNHDDISDVNKDEDTPSKSTENKYTRIAETI